MLRNRYIRKAIPSTVIALVLAVTSICANLNQRTIAANASMSFSPKTIMASGSAWSVQVRVNTGGQNVNAVQADFTYPTGVLTFVSIDATGSGFNFDAAKSGGSGSVSIVRGATGSPVSGDLLVATINFNVVGTGAANLVFQNSSVLLEPAGSTNILVTKTNGSYTSITGPQKTVYRMANYITKERLFTIDANERNYAVANYPGWVYEGDSFHVTANASAGAVPVYRLANYLTKERLFTTDANERDYAVAHYAGWVYEGVSFQVVAAQPGAIPVFRLSNYLTKERLFTTDANERDYAVAHYAGWVYDGISFYTAP